MNSEKKTCANCKAQFTIEPDDFAFYEKIGVPAPTWCPECRKQRRMAFRNERTLYKRKCDLCGKNKVSIYRQESPYKVYCYDCFYSDNWDQFASGKEYDFSKSFFEQYFELTLRAPKLGLQTSHDLVNSEYGNHCGALKNCYLIFASVNNEDCTYCNYVSYSRGIVDGLRVFKSEFCFECVDCQNCNNLKFSQQCQDSLDGYFLYNCRGCSNCFMCSNLIRQNYCIRNKQYKKEEYEKMISEFNLQNNSSIENFSGEFEEMKEHTLKRATEGFNHINSTGNYLTNTKNCKNCFDVSLGEDCRYVIYGNDVKDTMDAYAAYPKTELCYEVVGSGAPAYNAKFCYLPWAGSNLTYCINSFSNCHNCFGCNHIHDAEYCVLNKRYSKEEYEELVPKIIKHMDEIPYTDENGRVYKYGEYFPPALSPFAYNETIAQQYIPLEEKDAVSLGYKWVRDEKKDYGITKNPEDLPDSIDDVDDSILNEVIACSHKQTCSHQCTGAFKIVPQELQFYKQFRIPLPRLCPNCRHYRRLAKRNPFKLWHRTCMKEGCSNEFETSFSPERPEIVYCEECYQSEIV